jgi:hypothetical protein
MSPLSARHNGPVQWRPTECASRAGSAQAVVEQGLAKPVVKKKQSMKVAKQGRQGAPRLAQPPAVQGAPGPRVAQPPAVPVGARSPAVDAYDRTRISRQGRRWYWSWRRWWRGCHLLEWKRLKKRTTHEDGWIVVLV